MFKSIIMWILNNVFHIQTQTTEKEIEDNEKYANEYADIEDINFNSIFSNKLSNYTVSESEIGILGENVRAKQLDKIAQSIWKNMKKITAMSFGYGGILLVPYVQGGKIYYNKVTQDRLTIDMVEGDNITCATILAERKIIQSAAKQTIYFRWTNYSVLNGNLTITQVYTNEDGKNIKAPDFWRNIPEKIVISGVDRVPFGYIKSPINNRKSNDKYGVPITYGCEATIREIKDTLKQLKREYKLKETFVGMDYTLFKKDKDGNYILPESGLFKKFDLEDENYFVYDPPFRPYLDRLEELYRRLEHEVGTSGGILSQVQTSNATATEIKRSMYDTFSIVDQMRAMIEKGLEDFFYACNILANAYNVTPQGEYNIDYGWSNGMIEDPVETFNRMIIAESKGIIKKAEVREYLHPEETLEESQKVIDEIKVENPSIEDLLGTKNDNKDDEE